VRTDADAGSDYDVAVFIHGMRSLYEEGLVLAMPMA
jgi:hypothetical protein